MAGIGLCIRENNECPNKNSCLRYKEESNEMSAFFNFPVICNKENNYKWKWQIENVIAEVNDKKE